MQSLMSIVLGRGCQLSWCHICTYLNYVNGLAAAATPRPAIRSIIRLIETIKDSYNPCRANRHRSSLTDSFGRRHRIHSASDDLESGAGLAATHFTAQPGTISHKNTPLTSRQFTVDSALAQSRSKLSATAALPNSNNDEVAQHEWSSNPIENTLARGVREMHRSLSLAAGDAACEPRSSIWPEGFGLQSWAAQVVL